MTRATETIKLCKDCVWASRNRLTWLERVASGYSIDRCMHPQTQEFSIVDGTSSPSFCSSVRIGKCGREGRLFEPNEVSK